MTLRVEHVYGETSSTTFSTETMIAAPAGLSFPPDG
jgi:hypothetical protein